MKTKLEELNEKNLGIVVVNYFGTPITLQSPDAEKLRQFLCELRIALAEAGDFNSENGFSAISERNYNLRESLKLNNVELQYSISY